MHDDEELYDLADLFKLFGDSTRLRILIALSEGERNVNDLAEHLAMTQSAVSHQLSTLKAGKLVRSRREGKQMIYALDDEHVETIIALGIEHIEEGEHREKEI
ncbi:MAG: winged helix-turn-helix transcriptional regulator [Lachnospiraceae bacterium]|nr:winged helix-turn-helix transcriptional regulator [Lachnospiraceae bacterium]